MQIAIQLSDEYAKKLTYIQQQTDRDLIDTIKSSIDIHYQHLQQQGDDPLAKLKQGGFIGCFQAEPDLAANSEAILRSMIQEHDHC